MHRQSSQHRLFTTLDDLVAVTEQMAKDITRLKVDNETIRMELVELASRIDMRNPGTKSAAGVLPIGNEGEYRRVNEALQEGGLFEEMVRSIFLNVFQGYLPGGTGRRYFKYVRTEPWWTLYSSAILQVKWCGHRPTPKSPPRLEKQSYRSHFMIHS